ncbi:Alanine--tRNA ligase, cytoplasmic [Echinococcus granulosus]|uniref:Alanine--tRNA ligase n=1 Tax=Echinococcus granulosus TaxID=6210 RepID=U6J703_ECHGR|nr:Alanyl-tRNA synthetase, cytoplasmic [Echinococcus granulosus]EUB62782.1 Alanyl-tRNA synthetase, cytoplasmic [Echinococcus granulosus]KAH9281144.1 Alanine--tRNA ligase, cytoplasmic [Echinococcus granulosus]CDS19091.1 alanyl tRNA synthetase cytoplasmic [Echinococcus granulosus]
MENGCDAADIRSQFIEFFKSKGHKYVHSSSVIPRNDPTLLFTNAGMNQWKPIIQGTVDPNTEMATYKRVVNSQKCIRAGGKHNDLDDVGRDVYHHTFFEMLGNWSFGDYFKREACTWAWELLTKVWKLPEDRFYITYFGGDKKTKLESDEEVRQIWIDLGIPSERILPFGMKDNFWEMGETGPCGPCSEIHYDRIGGRDASKYVNMGDPDVLEIWNLVFMQYNREEDGSLRPLPAKHVDTGMGLERIVSVLQNRRSNYDTNLFLPYFEIIHKATGVRPYAGKLGEEDEGNLDFAYRVLADHARNLTIALSDGGQISNQGRGYVLRRILRRAIRYSIEVIGAKPGFFSSLVDVVVASLGDAFPEVKRDPAAVKALINEEEQQFLLTLRRGQRLLQREVERLKKSRVTTLPGAVAWRLYDTYGFPLDLTQVMTSEVGIEVDVEGYEKAKEEALLKSQGTFGTDVFGIDLDVHDIAALQNREVPLTDDSLKYEYRYNSKRHKYVFSEYMASILAIRTAEGFVESVEGAGTVCGLVLDRTIFYAEAGGQAEDHGFIVSEGNDANELSVFGVRNKGGFVLHLGRLEGSLSRGENVRMGLDTVRRVGLMRNHTATHVLNFALRRLLGEADQKGSLVAPDRLRFDFSTKHPLTKKQVRETEVISQKMIGSAQPIYAKDVHLADAKAIQGLRAVFGEVYPDPVRVVSVGVPVEKLIAFKSSDKAAKTSVELCGGTHVTNVAHIGKFVIVSEEAIAKGIRRIVAVTGPEGERAEKQAKHLRAEVAKHTGAIERAISNKQVDLRTCRQLAAKLSAVAESVDAAQIGVSPREAMRAAINVAKKRLDDFDKAFKAEMASRVMEEAKNLCHGHTGDFIVHVFNAGSNAKVLNTALKEIEKALPSTAVMALSLDAEDGEVLCLTQVPKALVTRGLKANSWVGCVSSLISGKGGGRETSAQASGSSNGVSVAQVVAAATEFVKANLK